MLELEGLEAFFRMRLESTHDLFISSSMVVVAVDVLRSASVQVSVLTGECL